MSKLYVVGIGPGAYEKMTIEAAEALKKSDVIIGYTVYVDLVKDHFPGKEFLTTPMKKEVDRCVLAFEEAMKGKRVSMICSGDAGVYGMAGLMYEVGEKYPEVEAKPEITIDDFDKVQIQVGEVIKCEPVPKAKKLLVSQIKIGAETRQIVSGIAKYYKPEEMVGKKVAVITNLKPCKLCGVESQGMILAAGDDEGNLSVVTVDKDIVSGSEIC